MSSTPFGEHLKREREMRGVSLEEVAAATRISPRFLEAIEKEHWDELPGGVFNRGFIRAIARFLGLDEDSLVAAYALETKGAVDARAVPEHLGEIPRNWRALAVAIVVLVLVIVLGWLAYRHYGERIAARFHRHTAETSDGARGMTFAGSLAGTAFQRAPGGVY
jgi:cytoskeleton protein RodZ